MKDIKYKILIIGSFIMAGLSFGSIYSKNFLMAVIVGVFWFIAGIGWFSRYIYYQ